MNSSFSVRTRYNIDFLHITGRIFWVEKLPFLETPMTFYNYLCEISSNYAARLDYPVMLFLCIEDGAFRRNEIDSLVRGRGPCLRSQLYLPWQDFNSQAHRTPSPMPLTTLETWAEATEPWKKSITRASSFLCLESQMPAPVLPAPLQTHTTLPPQHEQAAPPARDVVAHGRRRHIPLTVLSTEST